MQCWRKEPAQDRQRAATSTSKQLPSTSHLLFLCECFHSCVKWHSCSQTLEKWVYEAKNSAYWFGWWKWLTYSLIIFVLVSWEVSATEFSKTYSQVSEHQIAIFFVLHWMVLRWFILCVKTLYLLQHLIVYNNEIIFQMQMENVLFSNKDIRDCNAPFFLLLLRRQMKTIMQRHQQSIINTFWY